MPFLIIIDKSILQVNLVEWLKTMVADQNAEAVLDPRLPEKPSSRALKRALLVALRCVDPNTQKRPKMGHVIHMLEADEFPVRDVSLCKFLFTVPFLYPHLCYFLVMKHGLATTFLYHKFFVLLVAYKQIVMTNDSISLFLFSLINHV